MRFDQQPDEKYLAMLAEAGWRDRTQEEGIWTKQVPKGEWKPVADAERIFREIANKIRQDKGLEPSAWDFRWHKPPNPSASASLHGLPSLLHDSMWHPYPIVP